MTPPQQRMIEDMTVRGLVPSTQRVYLRAVRGLAAYYKRSPDTLSTRDIQRYLSGSMRNGVSPTAPAIPSCMGCGFSMGPRWAARPCTL